MKNILSASFLVPALAFACAAADFDVRDYGAKGDGAAKDTAAIQSAVDACAAAGGGRVVLEGGVFLTGSLRLRSGVEFHIDRTARLLASPDLADFPDRTDVKHVVTANLPRLRNACVIFADEAERIALTGEGTIDANGPHHIREKSGADWKGWRYERVNPPEKSLPRVVFFTGCRDVVIRGLTMVNQPAGWSYWIHDCDRVQITGLKILANVEYPNNDGIHLNCSRDVTVSDCVIETGDDAIVVRANSRSLRENKPMERLTVSNCSIKSWASGVRFAWTNDGVIRDCVFSNLVMEDTCIGVSFTMPKMPDGSDYGREATLIEDISFSNVRMNGIYAHPILALMTPDTNTLVKAVRNVRFSNVHATGLQFPHFVGRPETPYRGFVFDNCSFTKVGDDVLPDSRHHGCAAWDRYREERLDHTEGFVFNNTVFNNP